MNELRTMHLFAGIGGGLLADLILGHKPVIAVEWDKYACKVLRERAAEGWFPDLSVWEGDVRLFDPSEYTGIVDCIHAGFPCQDISVAGKQAGVSEGTRSGLYREVLRIAGVVRPRFLFLENVSAILSNGLGTVLADLAALGYDARWCCIRASDVGAPHHRDRWWLLAYAKLPDGSDALGKQCIGKEQHESGECSSLLSDTECTGLEGCCKAGNTYSFGGKIPDSSKSRCKKGNVSDTISKRQPGQGEFINAFDSKKEKTREAVNAFNGCQPGFWSVESSVGRVANGVPCRIQRLKGLGNAQVPLQAATAWKLLGGP